MKLLIVVLVTFFPLSVLAADLLEVAPVAVTIAGDNVDSPAIWISPQPENSLVFLTEKKGGTIMVFRADRKATFVKKIDGMERPNGIAVFPNSPFTVKDLLFVTDRDANRIHIYSIPDFKRIGVFAQNIPQPMGIALYQSKNDHVLHAYVVYKRAEGNDKVVRFRIIEENKRFSAIKEIQFGKELTAGQESVFVDPERKRVLVADENQKHIKVFDLDGRWEANFGQEKFQSHVEGIVIADCTQDYIIASDQRSKTEFEFFDRATYKHLATIRGKASKTDGIAVITQPLPEFPNGLFVAQSDPGNTGGSHAEFYDLNEMLIAAGLPSCVPSNAGRIPAPRLLLVLAIDQLQYQYLPRFQNLFSGGFKRLIEQGAVFSNAKYRHAATETGPGHAVILTGRHPSHTGIVANDWYDRFLNRSVNVVEDPAHGPVGGKGKSVSPTNLIGPTFGDLLKKQSPESKIVAVSLKDRSAVLMAGHRGDAAYWYEKNGTFITSTYYTDHSPEWLDQWNKSRPVERYAEKQWERVLSDIALYEKNAGPDQVVGEWENRDIKFPHRIHTAPPHPVFYNDFRRFPFADEIVFDLSVRAMREHSLGTDESTDILAIGFSATDVIGHTYGPDSQEMMDELLRLDLLLEQLFQQIDREVGLSNTFIVMTADHGVMPLAEILKSRRIEATRIRPSALEIPVIQALKSRNLNPYEIIANFEQPNFYLDHDAIQRSGAQLATVEKIILEALKETGFVEAVYTFGDFMKENHSSNPTFELLRNSFFAPRSPDILVVTKPYIYIEDYSGGTGHGTPHEYDRHVPIVFMGQGILSGNYQGECGPEDIVPTLGWLFGIPVQAEKDSRILTEILESKKTIVMKK